MKQAVHILATVRNEKLMHAALLVFKTLRVGFPNADVFVWGNNLNDVSSRILASVAQKVGGTFQNLKATTHGKWIETLVSTANAPFWICDTDMVFFGEMAAQTKGIFSGRFEPEFMEEWTRTRHMARLHPSLMWFNPAPLRAALRTWPPVSEFFSTVQRNLFEWEFVPMFKPGGRHSGRGRLRPVREVMFYDTCAGLYHALGGTPFNDKQNEAFEHLHCGTYADLIGQHLTLDGQMVQSHRAIFMEPDLARGIRVEQEKYYAKRSPKSRHAQP